MAEERNLDLVEVMPNQWPPICKIMDYGKYQYRKSKQERKKKIKNVEIKGIRFGIKISRHDLEFKARQTDKFLKRGDKVRIEMRLKGREKSLEGFAKEKINDFLSLITEPYRIEQELKKAPTGFVMTIAHE